ncbi:MAG: TrbG/VirB9 family P-type conjugative transfer protein [Rickettsiales bacterium]|nr:TrbG/VirB9 family P-type conjugative transfer protein [Rickettsiales bacterium]
MDNHRHTLKQLAYALTLSCALTSPALAAAWPDDGSLELPVDSRIKLLEYNETDIYTIMTKYGFQTNLVFNPTEEINTISVGDRSLWQIIPTGNRLFIRPLQEGLSTNMTVLTSRRSYTFDLKSVGENSKADIVYVAKFVYPQKRPPMPADPYSTQLPVTPMVTNVPLAIGHSPAPTVAAPAYTTPSDGMNYRYTFSGPDQDAPVQVYDDGSSTYIRYRDITQPLPNPYIVDATGTEKPVSYYIKDDMMVIERVAKELLLKNGGGTITIYNEAAIAR